MPFFTTSDGCRLFYEIRTEGADRPFVVFLNGFTQTTVYWYGRVPVFKKHFSILLYDARGQGRSDTGDKKLSLGRHVGDLAELLTHLRIDRTHLVGLSHGARVALAYAAEHPGRVGRLVLCGLGAGDGRQTGQVVSSWKSILASDRPERMAAVIFPAIFGKGFLKQHKGIMSDIATAVVARNRKDALLAQLSALPSYPPPESARVPETVNCLVLSGSDDTLVRPSSAAALADHLNGRHEVLGNTGHSIPIEAPGRFDRQVLSFLRPNGTCRPAQIRVENSK